ncbi:MAG TPA: hypothetical protein VK007_01890 [Acidimicrobiales bacterium]|nr:hypothetical protein [Acidimicrobiales bacterium]
MSSDHDSPMVGTPTGATTLIEALDQLRQLGYDHDLAVTDEAAVRCRSCGHEMPADGLDLDHLIRLEGASDPADMAAVLGISCTDCGMRGAAVVRYGPEASPAEAQLLRTIDDHRAR